MAFGDLVQSAENSGASGAASATLSVGATAGNLLIYAVARSAAHTAGGSHGTPTDFTNGPQTVINAGNLSGAMWFKYATGGETVISNSETSANGNWRAVVEEYEGPFDASPFDVSAESEASLSTVVTSMTTGTTGTTAQNDELAVGFWAADQASNVDGTRAYTNSFTERNFADDVSSAARAAVILASKVLSATGTVECTFSCTDTGDEMYGAVMTFKKASAAAGKVQRLGALGVG